MNKEEQTNHIGKTNKMVTAVDWFSEQVYILFNQFQYGDISMVDFRLKMVNIEVQAKAMEKEQIISAWIATDNELQRLAAEQYYNEKYKK